MYDDKHKFRFVSIIRLGQRHRERQRDLYYREDIRERWFKDQYMFRTWRYISEI